MAIEAVTFDFWNTLVREQPDAWDRRSRAWSAMLAEEGHEVSDEELAAAMEVGWSAHQRHWIDNTPFGAADAVEIMFDVLGVDHGGELSERFVAVITDPPMDAYPRLNPGVLDVLEALSEAGVRIGIICDVGLTPSTVLRRFLEIQGALDAFDHWSFSDEVGVFKPDAKIFRHALEGLGGVASDRAVHVGDLRRTDVFGAQSMGMIAVRYTGVYDDPGMPDSPVIEGDHVLADHTDLLEIISRR